MGTRVATSADGRGAVAQVAVAAALAAAIAAGVCGLPGAARARPAGPVDSAPTGASSAAPPPAGSGSAEMSPLPELPVPPTVTAVEIVGAGVELSELQPLVAVRTEAPLAVSAVRRTLERLYETGRFGDLVARVRPAPGGGGAATGRVVLVIETVPRTWIDRVVFEGNQALSTEALRRAAAVPERRTEFYPEYVARLVERLQAAYQRVGYASANIGSELTRTGRSEGILTFHVDEGPPTRIRAVTVAGDPQLALSEVLETIKLAPGDVLDTERLEAGVAALRARYRDERHYKARVGPPEVATPEGGGNGAQVRLAVSAGPRITFRFQGNRAFGDGELARVLAYHGEEPLDEAMLPQLEGRVADWYRLDGYADVQVRAREVPVRGGGGADLVVVFAIQEGEPLAVSEVRFEGNYRFTEKFLRERLEEALTEAAPEDEPESPNSADPGITGDAPARPEAHLRPDPTTVLYEPAYKTAIGRILDLYRADGYLSAFASLPDVERDQNTRQARVVIRVREGPRTFITRVEFDGGGGEVTAFGLAIGLRKGQPFNALEVETARAALQRFLGRRGYVFARVQDDEELSEDHTGAKVTFHIWLGPKVRVGRVLVQGLQRTSEGTVRAALALKENRVLDPEALAESQRNLIRMGIFRTATVRMNAPEMPEEVKDIYVEVDERSTIQVAVGGGYSLIDGPRAFAEFTKLNLFGRALVLQGRAKVNYLNMSLPVLNDPGYYQQGLDALGRRLNLSLQYPRILALLPTEVGARIDLVHERLNRFSYQFQRTAAITGIDLGERGSMSGSLEYEIETDRLTPGKPNANVVLSRSDLERQRFYPGRIDMHSIRPSFSLDMRDDAANPHKGMLLTTTIEFVQSLGGLIDDNGQERTPFAQFIKASAQANFYVPIWRRTVFAFSARGGKIFSLDPRSNTPPPKRFFLGGASSMRGFLDDAMLPEDKRQEIHDEAVQCQRLLTKTGCTASAAQLANGQPLLSLGGQLFVLGRAELRFPLIWQLEGALFLDSGNLWDDASQAMKAFRLRYATGFGIRLVTPIGPAALDLGINLDPDPLLNESRFVPNFSIGLF